MVLKKNLKKKKGAETREKTHPLAAGSRSVGV